MDNLITKDSALFLELIKDINLLIQISKANRNNRNDEYLTARQVCNKINISPRALQDYKDRRIIPHTRIGNIILYPLSGIIQVLERSYVSE